MTPEAAPRDALAGRIDHTLLRPQASALELRRHCLQALASGFAAVCVQPRWLELAVHELAGSVVAPCTVVAFPHGCLPSELKAAEAAWAAGVGARELDMVIDLGALKSARWREVRSDIEAVVAAAPGALIKVILETALLEDAEKRRACELACEAGAHFVKTSTGYAGAGATLEDVRLIRSCVGDRARVKASGGIRDRAQALAMLDAGADRLGTSHGVAIIS